jgi:hypothetical protein
MKSSKKAELINSKLLFLALSIAIPLILLASPVPIHAASITTTPASGTVGTPIQISGDGFAGQSATIHWDDQITLSNIPISETGELTCNLKVPSACRGDHVIKITDDSNWTASTASATFTVFPAITVSPRTSRPHTRITVIGNGFAASEKDIRITWDGTVLPGSATANAFGTWGITFDVPETNRGEHYISAFSSSTDASEIDELLFIVAPFAKVEPTSGPAGTEISVDGFGFRTGEDGITITWDDEIILCNIVGGVDGSWNAKLNIPPCTKGPHTIGVYGSSFTPKGIVPDIDFNVVPNIELQPASGNKGDKVTVNGAGFANGETITLSFEEITLDSKATTDDTGSFSTTFEVPQSRIKNNKVKATGSAGNSAEVIFVAEKISPPTPTLLSPPQGAKLKIFDSFSDVFLGPAKRLIGIVSYRDSRNQNLVPNIETFDWSDVNAEGKVSYTLQIGRGGDFSSQVLLKENLADSEYDLTRNDVSTKDIYSWRVKATDDVGNESPWSEAQEFDLIPMSNQTLILTLAIPILFIAAIVTGVILTLRKNRTNI